MANRSLTFLTAFLLMVSLSGCGTDTKTTENLGASAGQAHYGGIYIGGNDNPDNRAQYMGYSVKGTVNVGGTGNGSSPAPSYTEVDYTISCLSCHPPTPGQPNGDTSLNAVILKDYATTGHADVTAIPWTVPEIGGNCQRCHTTFGFLYHLENYNPALPFTGITLSSPDLNPQWTGTILSTPLNQREEYRKAMQVLICSACHPENGLLTGALRASSIPDGYVANWTQNSITALVSFPDAGASNLCIRCHSARRGGANITQLATTTPHYLPAAATVYSGTADLINITANTTTIVGTGTVEAPEFPAPAVPPFVNAKFTGVAYEFPGQSYVTPVPSHKNVGSPGGKGPCVGCHMSGAAGHTLKSVIEDSTGEIAAISSNACIGCHGPILPIWLNDKKAAFQAAAIELDGELQSKGFFLNPADGNFYRDSAFSQLLGLGATNAERTASAKKYYDDQADAFGLDYTDLRGAAYNLWLLQSKSGDPAAYVHNSNYTKKVLFDTLDYLDNGTFDGVITLSDLVVALYLDGDSSAAGVQRP
ncbi:MAG: hypothetical protein U1D97_00750 [Desulfuromonadales bacterium]|nr:hypothetical protein [Desulfuromonadales bacterium]